MAREVCLTRYVLEAVTTSMESYTRLLHCHSLCSFCSRLASAGKKGSHEELFGAMGASDLTIRLKELMNGLSVDLRGSRTLWRA